MKYVIFFAIVVLIYFLYQIQLGAIGFLLLSFFFFFLAWREIFKKTNDR